MGSGKSAVAEILVKEGYPVFSCDKIYTKLLNDSNFLGKLSTQFDGIITPDGALDRAKLSETVFNDKSALSKLNALTHPAIMEEVLKKSKKEKLSFTEVPLLFENGFERYFDSVIVVLRDENERINAIVERDGIEREKVILRLKSQFNYDKCNFAKYYVIHNCSNFADLEQKTIEILKKITVRYKVN
ncbi:MAG: dephospho-CoA kinase [Clostridia bacterium]|nr:dephospho-CoA kinase [Clostridia bacterium]